MNKIIMWVLLLSSCIAVASCDIEDYRMEKYSKESLANSVWTGGLSQSCECTIDGVNANKSFIDISKGADGNHVIISIAVSRDIGDWTITADGIKLSGTVYDVSFDQNAKVAFTNLGKTGEDYEVDAKVVGHLKNHTYTKSTYTPIIVGDITYDWTKDGRAHSIRIKMTDPR